MAEITLCTKCSKPVPTHVEKCPYCGVKLSNTEITLTERYPALSTIALLMKAVAILPMVLSLFIFFTPAPLITAIASVVGCAVWAVLIYAASESITIFIDMERNQRQIIKVLNKQ